MDEATVVSMLGSGGVMGVIAYVLIRYVPMIEALVLGKHRSAKHIEDHPPAHHGVAQSQKNGAYVTWSALVEHCDREYKRSTEMTTSRFKALEESVGELRVDIREGLKTLSDKIDRRFNGTAFKSKG